MNQPIAIIGAMAPEIERLKAVLTLTDTTIIGGTTIYHGRLDSYDVLLMQGGIGKVNAAIGVTLLIDHFNAGAVINTGTAGGLSPTLDVGDVVIASHTLYHDVDITAFGYAKGQMAQMPASYTGDSTLIAAATKASTAFDNAHVHHGLIVSGDQFIAKTMLLARIREDFPDALAVEMEAAAIAQTCYRFNVPCVIIRSISDTADEGASTSFEQFVDTASEHSAKMVQIMLKLL